MELSRRLNSGWILAGFVIFIAAGQVAFGCSVPVFRYALERWASDGYIAEVEKPSELSEGEAAALTILKKYSRGEEATLTNVYVGEFKPSAEENDDSAAKLSLRFPMTSRITVQVWSTGLTEDNVKKMIDSPARQQVVNRLLGGDSAVWLFVESGNKEKDDAAAKLVSEKLASLVKELQLPEEGLEGLDKGYAPSLIIPEENEDAVKIAFSMLRVRRDDPAEAFLVHSLLRTEKDLLEYDEPIVFPVFGRGRILFALVGKGINEDNITEACAFLAGPCSCTVKALNPGVDMLISVDWDEELYGQMLVKETQVPELSGLGNYTEFVIGDTTGDADGSKIIDETTKTWHLIFREIRFRKLNFSLTVVSAMAAVACLVGAVTVLLGYELESSKTVAAKEAQTKVEMDKLNSDVGKAMLKLGFNVVILPGKTNFHVISSQSCDRWVFGGNAWIFCWACRRKFNDGTSE